MTIKAGADWVKPTIQRGARGVKHTLKNLEKKDKFFILIIKKNYEFKQKNTKNLHIYYFHGQEIDHFHCEI